MIAARRLNTARALWFELPDAYNQLRTGMLSERVAETVVAETRRLDAATRRRVDEQLMAAGINTMGFKAATACVRKYAYQADPEGYLQRGRTERRHRRVGVRPAPDTMAILTGYLSVEQAVACYAALRRYADTLVAAGDKRTRDQIMADTLVERLTGQATATDVNAELQIMMPLEALIDPHSNKPATIPGYGPLPVDLARNILERPLWPDRGRRPRAPQVRRLARPTDQTARPRLPRPPLRRTHPTYRPHHPPQRRRAHHPRKWARHLRTRQLCPRNARLAHQSDRRRTPRPTTHHPHHHTHRPLLPEPRPRPTMTLSQPAVLNGSGAG